MQHLRQAARRDAQSETGPEQMSDLRQRNTQVRVQLHGQRDDLGAELHASRPSASEVCSGLRPCTRRRHCEQWPTSMSKRRTTGRTTGRSSWYCVATRVTSTAPPQSGHVAGADAE